jgi:hypothetical protein
MRNIIGIDPAFYEYIFTVDADTVRICLSARYLILADEFILDRYTRFAEPIGSVKRR